MFLELANEDWSSFLLQKSCAFQCKNFLCKILSLFPLETHLKSEKKAEIWFLKEKDKT